ncbi:MAG: methyl-accepting chemotaxis protein [Thermomicrobiales bacterium]
MIRRINEAVVGRLNEGQRLWALALVPIAALFIFAAIVASNDWNERSKAEDVETAVEYSELAGNLLHELQFERALLVLRSEDASLVTDQQLSEQYARTDAASDAFLGLVGKNLEILGPENQEAIEHIVGDLREDEIVRQRAAIANGTATPDEIIGDYTDVTGELLESVAIVPSLSPQVDIALELDSYLNLLEAQDAYSIEAAKFISVFASNTMAEDQLADLRGLTLNAADDLANFEANAQPSVLRQYEQLNTMDAFADVEEARQTAYELGTEGDYGISPAGWHDAAMERVQALYTVQQVQETALLDDASDLSSAATTALIWSVALAAGAILLAVILAITVSRSFLDPLGHLRDISEEIQAGNLSARANLHDEHAIGRTAGALNLALDEVTSLVQTREERDRIQQQIITLLDEVSAVAEGDLTVEAEVTADALGSVADSFNYMISELRDIVASVNRTTAEVTAASGDIARSSTTLAESSELQARQIADAAIGIEEMALAISKVSESGQSWGFRRQRRPVERTTRRRVGACHDRRNAAHPPGGPGHIPDDQAAGRKLAGDRLDRRTH